MHLDNKCMFQANVSNDDVTMSQKITSDRLRRSIKKIFSSNSSSYVKLTKLFYNENDFAIGQG